LLRHQTQQAVVFMYSLGPVCKPATEAISCSALMPEENGTGAAGVATVAGHSIGQQARQDRLSATLSRQLLRTRICRESYVIPGSFQRRFARRKSGEWNRSPRATET
jgi:hypothetical protein